MLKKITIRGLKSLEKFSEEFSKDNEIQGRNGIGKTSIKDAISFVLYGKISNSDRIDGAINNTTKQIKVSAVFTLKNKDYIIERTRTTKGSSPSINGRVVEQADINALFGDHDEFICSNFVGEFMKFSEADRRSILMSKLEPVNREMIFKNLTGEDPKIVDLDNLEDTEKKIKKQYKELEAERNLLSSQKELLNNDLINASRELDELKEKEIQDVSVDIAKTKRELDNLIADGVKYSDYLPEKPNTDDIDSEIKKIEEAIFTFKRNMPDQSDIIALQEVIKAKKAQLEKVQASTSCPTCKRPYENADDSKVKAEELNAEILKDFKQWKHDKELFDSAVNKYEENNAKLELNREKLIAGKDKLMRMYDEAMIEAKDKYEKDSASQKNKISELQMLLSSLSSKDQEYSSHKMRVDMMYSKVKELKEKVDSLEIKIKKKDGKTLENIMKAFGPKGILFQEIREQQETINSKLPKNISIEFMKENKTNDGFKPAFEVSMDGIAYNWLSTGMKLFVDMHLISLFDKSIMAVIDNYESYTGKNVFKNKQVIKLIAKDSDLIIKKK